MDGCIALFHHTLSHVFLSDHSSVLVTLLNFITNILHRILHNVHSFFICFFAIFNLLSSLDTDLLEIFIDLIEDFINEISPFPIQEHHCMKAKIHLLTILSDFQYSHYLCLLPWSIPAYVSSFHDWLTSWTILTSAFVYLSFYQCCLLLLFLQD